jgi:hypothetical protein
MTDDKNVCTGENTTTTECKEKEVSQSTCESTEQFGFAAAESPKTGCCCCKPKDVVTALIIAVTAFLCGQFAAADVLLPPEQAKEKAKPAISDFVPPAPKANEAAPFTVKKEVKQCAVTQQPRKSLRQILKDRKEARETKSTREGRPRLFGTVEYSKTESPDGATVETTVRKSRLFGNRTITRTRYAFSGSGKK